MAAAERLYQDNLRLAKAEYLLQHTWLHARPRLLGLVLSNRCNLRCVHCYQARNCDSLFGAGEIGRELRRELAGFYPYLSTLDLLGGEVFLSPGFSELIDDVAAMVSRPILRITTNGTLIDDAWAERIVRTPFHSVTVSIDGGTPATYRHLRRGAELETVLAGIRRIQTWKQKLASDFPHLDSFFVVMHSNFREIPRYLELMRDEGVTEVALETMRVNAENTARTPTLVDDEAITSPLEVAELHGVLREALSWGRRHLRAIRVSGLATLFAAHGLDTSFLREEGEGLYPESDDLRTAAGGFELCPNPWTLMFITESGNVHLCFLSEPIGNLYETPLAEIWNSPKALAKRSRMISGRYVAAACSEPSCSWREGGVPVPSDRDQTKLLLAEMKDLTGRAGRLHPAEPEELPALDAVRRRLTESNQNAREWEALFRHLCETNGELHAHGQAHIGHLEAEMKTLLVRVARKVSRAIAMVCRR
jgi:MoaA/NifB/PqqE/SkfB family radical SAM enzyme